MPYIVVDICHTLYWSNTTNDFLLYFFREHSTFSKSLAAKFILLKWSPVFWLLAVVSRVSKADVHKKVLLLLLNNISTEELSKAALRFESTVLSTKKNEAVWKIMANAQLQGCKILLLSASIEPVVDAIASRYGYEGKGTTLEVKEGFFTGRLLFDPTGRKEVLLPKGEIIELVISDNASDLKLMKYAQKAIAVVHSGNKQFWQKVNWVEQLPITHD
jgi:phosphoserine phosphatase